MSYRLLLLACLCGSQFVFSASRADAQFMDAVRGEYGTTNRLRSEGEATSAGDPGDPRGETSSSRFGRDFSTVIDPFSDKLIDPRIGDAFDPEVAIEGRFFKATRSFERDDEVTVMPQFPAANVPTRRINPARRAQFVARLDSELTDAVQSSRAAYEQVLHRVRRSLLALAGESISASTEDGVIVLRGTVEDEYRRRMIERFVLLEPGVGVVRNEINQGSHPPADAFRVDLNAPSGPSDLSEASQSGVFIRLDATCP